MQSLLLNSNLLHGKQEKFERKKIKSGKFSIFPIKYFCFGTLWEYFCLIGLQCIFNWGFSGLPRKICIQHVSFPFVLEWERSKCYQNSDVAGFVFCGQGAPNHNSIAHLHSSAAPASSKQQVLLRKTAVKPTQETNVKNLQYIVLQN